MPWKVTDATWLKTEGNRIEAIVLLPKFWHRAWTDSSLKDALEEIGLAYSMPEIRLLNDELHKRGIVQDLP